MVQSAQQRTKTWLDTYITPANLKEDDGSTNASYLVMYAFPNYPLTEEFDTQSFDCIFAIDASTNSVALIDCYQYTYGYDEDVPIYLCTIDKTGITGVKMLQKMLAELRLIEETYPFGSLRLPNGEKPETVNLGSAVMFQLKCIVRYVRDTAT